MSEAVEGTKARRRGGRALRAALVVALLAKVAVAALWYTGGLSTALAVAAEAVPRQLASVEHTAIDAAPKAAERSAVEGVKTPERTTADAAAKPPEARALLDAITRRQSELDTREHEIAAREERLRVFEQDVVAKVASLEEIEKRLQGRAKAASAAVDAAAESLAKVYGAMKPADAAPILERLDDATVLGIFGRMKEKQIGEILPLMTKEKAIALTRALATSPAR